MKGIINKLYTNYAKIIDDNLLKSTCQTKWHWQPCSKQTKLRKNTQYIQLIKALHNTPFVFLLQNDIKIKTHNSIRDRCNAARMFQTNYNPNCTVLVDSMLDIACTSYGATPIRLHIVKNNNLEYEGGTGPFMYDMESVRHWLQNYKEATWTEDGKTASLACFEMPCFPPSGSRLGSCRVRNINVTGW